jgi:Holliday junction DNA helicase RuvA
VIAHLRGSVLSRKAGQLVIDCGGVGYSVNVTPDLYQLSFTQQELSLHTAHIIREDAQMLFGFQTEEELEGFNLLCSVSGVGPKSALSVLAHLGVDGIAKAVATADDSMFKAVTGIGPKTAKLIVLSLTGKLVSVEGEAKSSGSSESSVIAALVGLGYQEKFARTAVEAALKSNPASSESELLKLSLSNLSSGRK